MQNSVPKRSRLLAQLATVASIAIMALSSAPASAVDVLGFYVGGAVGQAQVSTGAPEFTVDGFRENHAAFKLMAGVRPISLIGAEIEYVDFGNPSGAIGPFIADAKIKGTAGFGLFYLPIPAPFVDVYVKAGAARLTSTVNGYLSAVSAFRSESTDTRFAAGVGTQLKFGSLAIRAEYERFDVAGGNPGLLSLGLTKTFF